MVNDEEATFTELNWLCGTKHNISFGVRMPKKRMHVQASMSGGGTEESFDNENVDAWNLVFDENIISKFFPISGKFSFNFHGDYFDNSRRAEIPWRTNQVG